MTSLPHYLLGLANSSSWSMMLTNIVSTMYPNSLDGSNICSPFVDILPSSLSTEIDESDFLLTIDSDSLLTVKSDSLLLFKVI
nr:hypothetical protein Itr_chr12CG22520 [Ipomoea trifida]